MRQDANAELLVEKPMTAHLQRQVEEASQMAKERMRTALLFEGGHDYPFTPKDLMAGHFNKVSGSGRCSESQPTEHRNMKSFGTRPVRCLWIRRSLSPPANRA